MGVDVPALESTGAAAAAPGCTRVGAAAAATPSAMPPSRVRRLNPPTGRSASVGVCSFMIDPFQDAVPKQRILGLSGREAEIGPSSGIISTGDAHHVHP